MSEPRILSLDLGTNTGVCFSGAGGMFAETHKWTIHKLHRQANMDRRADPRIIQFFAWLQTKIGLYDIVVFEDVEFSKTTLQTQLWASFRACVWLAFGGRSDVFIDAVPVGTLKKFATGSGAAEKIDMARALCRRFPKRFELAKNCTFKRVQVIDHQLDAGSVLDDNAVDAIFLNLWAQTFIKL